MDEEEFKARTKNLALAVLRLVEGRPRNRATDVIARQLLRSATSVGANYRSACRAKSVADMILKPKTVEEDADETRYWLELLAAGNYTPPAELVGLARETNEILAMTVASIKTLRARNTKS